MRVAAVPSPVGAAPARCFFSRRASCTLLRSKPSTTTALLTSPASRSGQAAQAMYADRAVLRARANAAVDLLKAQAAEARFPVDRIGAIGFCFGGATVLELARSGADLAGVVSFHGNLSTSIPAKAGDVKASLLVLNGADDSYVPAEQIGTFQKEMTDAKADWQFVNYSGAVHCFAEADANSPGCLYEPRAAKRAYAAMESFFDEKFGD